MSSSPIFFGWLPSILGKMATAMCNVARCVLIRKFNFEGAKNRLFHSFGIKDALVKRLANLRIEKPTAIQEKVSYACLIRNIDDDDNFVIRTRRHKPKLFAVKQSVKSIAQGATYYLKVVSTEPCTILLSIVSFHKLLKSYIPLLKITYTYMCKKLFSTTF